MSDIKLFRLANGTATELSGKPFEQEKELQTMIEKHIKTLLHVRFVAREYSTGNAHAGRIDTLGIDENFCPTIIEYKRSSTNNVISQGLFYLNWLMNHKAEFKLLVQEQFGQDDAKKLDWSAPHLLFIAEDYTRYDKHAILQINRNIDLIRYHIFGDDLLLLDLVNVVPAVSAKPEDEGDDDDTDGGPKQDTMQKKYMAKISPQLKELYEAVRAHVTDLGDDVQERFLKSYIAYKRMKNFATIQFRTGSNILLMRLSLSPEKVELKDGFSRDVRGVGHQGTGDLELTIRTRDDLIKAGPLIQKSFEEN